MLKRLKKLLDCFIGRDTQVKKLEKQISDKTNTITQLEAEVWFHQKRVEQTLMEIKKVKAKRRQLKEKLNAIEKA